MSAAQPSTGKRPRLWLPRYSLRTLLAVMTVACLVSGFWLNKAIRQREAVRRFNQLTADRPNHDGESLITTLYRHAGQVHSRPILPQWLRPLSDLIGDEAFGEVIGLQLLDSPTKDEDLRYLADVPTVEQVWLSDTQVTDEGLAHLEACPKLTFLTLDNTAVTDDGLARLTKLPDLETLSLSGTQITDRGLVELAKLTKLKELWLRGTGITDEGYRQLEAALPACHIQADVPAYSQKQRELYWSMPDF